MVLGQLDNFTNNLILIDQINMQKYKFKNYR